MASELYGEEWNSEEFQTALKVVLKVEIQSLLERLSETGEETVVVTASAADGVTGHLASSNAIRFINTADMGTVKSKFLTFLTGGGQTQVGKQTVQASPVVRGQMSPSASVICNNMMSKAPAPLQKSEPTPKKLDVNVVPPAQTKGPEKRPLDQGPGSIGVVQPLDPKRRKTDTQPPLVKGVSSVSQQPGSATSVAQTLANSNKPQAPKLKTTKVVSKSGGFTEERISDAEFQKFLAQYKPEIPEGEEDDEDEDSDIDNRSSKLRTGSIIPTQQKQLQSHPGSSVQNTQNKGPSLGNTSNLLDKNAKGRIIPSSVNQSVKNVNQSSEIKKDNSNVKVDSVCVEDDVVTEIKEEDDPQDLAYKEAQVTQKPEQSLVKGSQDSQQKKETVGQADKTGAANKSRKRIDNIDNMDTATLIEMTKAKHLENMSPADREIQAKLGQISSKLSWVVEYPQDKKGQPVPISHSTPVPRGPEGAGVMGLHGPFPHSEGEEYDEMEEDELDDEDEDDEDFNEDELDEEDKAKLKALREEHMRKAYIEGYEVSQDFHGMGHMMGPGFPEDYGEDDDEEGEEDYEDYGDEMEIHMQGNRMAGAMPGLIGPNLGPGPGEGMNASVSQLYQRSASPTSENFLMIGPIMAKCLICNKIVRKMEMKAHNETHLEDEVYNEDEEEEEEIPEEDLEGIGEEEHQEEGHFTGEQQEEDGEFGEEEGGDYSEEYTIHEDTSQEPVFTAEKFVAETLVAEKLEDSSVEMTTIDDSQSNICDICNKTFKSKANMQRHKKTQHAADGKPSEIICPCCNKKYKPSSIKNHMKKLHPEYKEPLPVNVGSEISADGYKCGMCGEDFTTEDLLQDHVKENHV